MKSFALHFYFYTNKVLLCPCVCVCVVSITVLELELELVYSVKYREKGHSPTAVVIADGMCFHLIHFLIRLLFLF